MKKILVVVIAVSLSLSFGSLAKAETSFCCKLNIMCRTPAQSTATFNRFEFVQAKDDLNCYAMANKTGGWGTGCYAEIDSRSGSNRMRAKDPKTGNYECLATSEMYIPGTCVWTLANNCTDIDKSLVIQSDETKCSGTKPNGTTAKCCCPASNSAPSYKASSGATAPNLPNPLGCQTIPCVIGTIISKLLSILGAIALLVFIYGGFRWLTAAGNDKNIAAGKETLVWATIGIIFIFLSYILVGFILQSLGV